MAKIFAGKHNYSVDANQELLAQGGSNLVGSFFSCGPVSVSLSRSVIQEQVGGRTQLASLFSCTILIFVLLWIGPFFETLPNCVLSSIIVVALKGMFLQVKDMRSAWMLSKLNAFIWLITFLSTVVLDIEYGLAVGVVLSVLTLLWRSNRPDITVLGAYDRTELYLDVNSSEQVKELPRVKIVKYNGCLNFATAENFTVKMLKLVPLKEQPKKGKLKIPKIIPSISTISKERITDDTSICTGEANISIEDKVQYIILDLSSVSSLDPEAAKSLNALFKKYAAEIVQVMLAGCTEPVLEVMKTCGVLSQVGMRHVFPTVHDAVVYSGLDVVNRHSPTPIHTANYDYPTSYESESDSEVVYQELESSVRRHSANPPDAQ
jgi:solute carrier family 26 protein